MPLRYAYHWHYPAVFQLWRVLHCHIVYGYGRSIRHQETVTGHAAGIPVTSAVIPRISRQTRRDSSPSAGKRRLGTPPHKMPVFFKHATKAVLLQRALQGLPRSKNVKGAFETYPLKKRSLPQSGEIQSNPRKRKRVPALSRNSLPLHV